jgi:hypothetical protein
VTVERYFDTSLIGPADFSLSAYGLGRPCLCGSTARIYAQRRPNDIGFAKQKNDCFTMAPMLAKLQSSQSIPQMIAWVSEELEGFVR